MKRIVALMLVLVLALGLAACGAKQEPAAEEQPVGMANPMTEYSSLAELNTAAETMLVQPSADVTEEQFFTVHTDQYLIAEYRYTLGSVKYTLRCAPAQEDISGFYTAGSTAFPGDRCDTVEYCTTETAALARWFVGELQYCLAAEPAPEDFERTAQEVSTLYMPVEGSAFLAGSYYDTVSQKASLLIEDNFDGTVQMTVIWSSSVSQITRWEMTAKMNGAHQLVYENGKATDILYADDGTEMDMVLSENEAGYFTANQDGTILWDGAADENCAQCVFEPASIE